MDRYAPAGSDSGARRGAYLALVLMIVIWAVNFSVAKIALGWVTPLALNGLRFPFAALVVLVALRLGGPIPLPRRADLGRVLLVGLVGNVLYQLFFIFGLALTRAGTAAVLLAGTPILTAALSHLAGHERVDRRVWIGVVATFTGIVLVVRGTTHEPGAGTLLGDLLMIGASFAWAAYTVGSRPLIARYGSVAVTAWTLWIGAIALVTIGLRDIVATDLRALPAGVWLAVFYAGALSLGVAYLIWYHAVRVIGNTRTGVFSNLVPAIALLAAWLWLGEIPSTGQLGGAGVVLAGVMIAQQRRPAWRGPPRP